MKWKVIKFHGSEPPVPDMIEHLYHPLTIHYPIYDGKKMFETTNQLELFIMIFIVFPMDFYGFPENISKSAIIPPPFFLSHQQGDSLEVVCLAGVCDKGDVRLAMAHVFVTWSLS